MTKQTRSIDIAKKSRLALTDDYKQVYEEILCYYRTGETELTETNLKILDRWRSAYALLLKYPSKTDVVKHLAYLYPGISDATLYNDVNYAIKFWNFNSLIDKEFIEMFFVEKLMYEIAKDGLTESARSKNLATLQKYIESLPEHKIDPKHIESNQVNIQINMNGEVINIPENMMGLIPEQLRTQIVLNSQEIDVDRATEIMES